MTTGSYGSLESLNKDERAKVRNFKLSHDRNLELNLIVKKKNANKEYQMVTCL